MLLWLIVLIIFQIAQSTPLEHMDPYIVNGFKAKPNQFPWQAGIFIQTGEQLSFCGGALISSEWVLSAAHCFERLDLISKVRCAVQAVLTIHNPVICFKSPAAKVYLGGTGIRNYTVGTVLIPAIDIILHENYDEQTLNNDVAVVRLAVPVVFSKSINAIPLAKNLKLKGKEDVIVSGWGQTSEKPTKDLLSPDLLFVPLKTIPTKKCLETYAQKYLENGKICAVGSNKRSICQGDSGGPLVLPGKQPKHIGIVSFTSVKGCERGDPQGFTSTAHYYNWIKQHCHCVP